MQRRFGALHGALDSYLNDALQEGSAYAVVCLRVPRAHVFSSFILLFAWRSPLLFLVRFFSSNEIQQSEYFDFIIGNP
jgi:hypothetical protein